MENYDQQIKKANELINTLKQAFQPMPGAAPAGAPPMDPAMMQQGGAPPMDPAMMQQQGGGAPPPGDPAQMEAMVSEIMSAVEQLASAVEQDKQIIGQLQQQLQEMGQAHAEIMAKMDAIEKSVGAPSPMEGVPANMM